MTDRVGESATDLWRRRGWWRNATYLDDFLAHADDDPGRLALVGPDAITGEPVRLSFGELRDRVDRMASGLLEVGVRRQEVVSFQLPNSWQFAVTALACARAGAVPNPIIPILREREMRQVLASVATRWLIVATPRGGASFDQPAMVGAIADDLPHLLRCFVVGGQDAGLFASFEAHFVDSVSAVDRRVLDRLRPSPDDRAQVQFTSGTTGVPKGVVHTYNTLRAGYRGLVERLGLASQDKVMVLSTMAHQTGFLSGCVMPMAEGMAVVCLDHWDPQEFLEVAAAEGITYTSGASTFMVDACRAARETGRRLPSLAYFRGGGGPVPASVVHQVQRDLGAKVVVAWGMTENGICTLTSADGPVDEASYSDGTPLPWVELRVTDLLEGDEVGAGEEGLLWIQSASQCVDYVPDHETFVAAHDGPWFNTGDLARLQPDGSIRIVGRVKDLIIRGGENIPALEVERALALHDDIIEVVVVGIPDDRLGERACAVMTVADGAGVDLSRVQAHLDSLGMAKQYWPEYLLVREGLLRSASGKIAKDQLRIWATEELGSFQGNV